MSEASKLKRRSVPYVETASVPTGRRPRLLETPISEDGAEFLALKQGPLGWEEPLGDHYLDVHTEEAAWSNTASQRAGGPPPKWQCGAHGERGKVVVDVPTKDEEVARRKRQLAEAERLAKELVDYTAPREHSGVEWSISKEIATLAKSRFTDGELQKETCEFLLEKLSLQAKQEKCNVRDVLALMADAFGQLGLTRGRALDAADNLHEAYVAKQKVELQKDRERQNQRMAVVVGVEHASKKVESIAEEFQYVANQERYHEACRLIEAKWGASASSQAASEAVSSITKGQQELEGAMDSSVRCQKDLFKSVLASERELQVREKESQEIVGKVEEKMRATTNVKEQKAYVFSQTFADQRAIVCNQHQEASSVVIAATERYQFYKRKQEEIDAVEEKIRATGKELETRLAGLKKSEDEREKDLRLLGESARQVDDELTMRSTQLQDVSLHNVKLIEEIERELFAPLAEVAKEQTQRKLEYTTATRIQLEEKLEAVRDIVGQKRKQRNIRKLQSSCQEVYGLVHELEGAHEERYRDAELVERKFEDVQGSVLKMQMWLNKNEQKWFVDMSTGVIVQRQDMPTLPKALKRAYYSLQARRAREKKRVPYDAQIPHQAAWAPVLECETKDYKQAAAEAVWDTEEAIRDATVNMTTEMLARKARPPWYRSLVPSASDPTLHYDLPEPMEQPEQPSAPMPQLQKRPSSAAMRAASFSRRSSSRLSMASSQDSGPPSLHEPLQMPAAATAGANWGGHSNRWVGLWDDISHLLLQGTVRKQRALLGAPLAEVLGRLQVLVADGLRCTLCLQRLEWVLKQAAEIDIQAIAVDGDHAAPWVHEIISEAQVSNVLLLSCLLSMEARQKSIVAVISRLLRIVDAVRRVLGQQLELEEELEDVSFQARLIAQSEEHIFKGFGVKEAVLQKQYNMSLRSMALYAEAQRLQAEVLALGDEHGPVTAMETEQPLCTHDLLTAPTFVALLLESRLGFQQRDLLWRAGDEFFEDLLDEDLEFTAEDAELRRTAPTAKVRRQAMRDDDNVAFLEGASVRVFLAQSAGEIVTAGSIAIADTEVQKGLLKSLEVGSEVFVGAGGLVKVLVQQKISDKVMMCRVQVGGELRKEAAAISCRGLVLEATLQKQRKEELEVAATRVWMPELVGSQRHASAEYEDDEAITPAEAMLELSKWVGPDSPGQSGRGGRRFSTLNHHDVLQEDSQDSSHEHRSIRQFQHESISVTAMEKNGYLFEDPLEGEVESPMEKKRNRAYRKDQADSYRHIQRGFLRPLLLQWKQDDDKEGLHILASKAPVNKHLDEEGEPFVPTDSEHSEANNGEEVEEEAAGEEGEEEEEEELTESEVSVDGFSRAPCSPVELSPKARQRPRRVRAAAPLPDEMQASAHRPDDNEEEEDAEPRRMPFQPQKQPPKFRAKGWQEDFQALLQRQETPGTATLEGYDVSDEFEVDVDLAEYKLVVSQIEFRPQTPAWLSDIVSRVTNAGDNMESTAHCRGCHGDREELETEASTTTPTASELDPQLKLSAPPPSFTPDSAAAARPSSRERGFSAFGLVPKTGHRPKPVEQPEPSENHETEEPSAAEETQRAEEEPPSIQTIPKPRPRSTLGVRQRPHTPLARPPRPYTANPKQRPHTHRPDYADPGAPDISVAEMIMQGRRPAAPSLTSLSFERMASDETLVDDYVPTMQPGATPGRYGRMRSDSEYGRLSPDHIICRDLDDGTILRQFASDPTPLEEAEAAAAAAALQPCAPLLPGLPLSRGTSDHSRPSSAAARPGSPLKPVAGFRPKSALRMRADTPDEGYVPSAQPSAAASRPTSAVGHAPLPPALPAAYQTPAALADSVLAASHGLADSRPGTARRNQQGLPDSRPATARQQTPGLPDSRPTTARPTSALAAGQAMAAPRSARLAEALSQAAARIAALEEPAERPLPAAAAARLGGREEPKRTSVLSRGIVKQTCRGEVARAAATLQRSMAHKREGASQPFSRGRGQTVFDKARW
eukprot:TRINITY_DN32640_c0_g2_i1.p1 TRINITY_DN32640_c0_g2~~TRINITY_DN32640_c0_g2_i1.p1  ORF type:complete len:1991 (+),score=513.00 TRINITY_DN32640_c0_g2_i1:159-6131(+)